MQRDFRREAPETGKSSDRNVLRYKFKKRRKYVRFEFTNETIVHMYGIIAQKQSTNYVQFVNGNKGGSWL